VSVEITFLREGATRPVVVAPGGTESPEGLSLTARRAADMPEPLRAEDILLLDRKNLRHEFSFGVWREHATPDEAFAFMLDHPTQVCGVGQLDVRIEMGGRTVRRAARAHIEIVDSNHHGIGTEHRYRVLCGAIQ
jgi:hypothetical protein